MTDEAVSACLIFLMAGDTPTHLERGDLFNPLHFLNRTVTRLALDTGPEMSLVIKTGKHWKLMNPNPWNRLLVSPVGLNF